MRISAIVLLFAALVNLTSGLPVGSGEKPPIIHFPPPPPVVSFAVGLGKFDAVFLLKTI